MENELLSLKKDSEIKALIAKTDAILEERNRLARELHDDIGSSMSSVNIYAEVALRELEKNPEKSKFAIEKQKKQISTINENISDLIWAIYSKNERFTNLFERIRDFAFDILNTSNIHFEFLFDDRLNNLILKPDAKKNLLLIVKEFINNSLKYSSARKIQVKFNLLNSEEFQLTLEDNGTGFNINAVRKGNGIDSFYKRAESMKAKIEFNSIIGNGTYLKINTSLNELVDEPRPLIS
jgi:signal transduction histidine kinase